MNILELLRLADSRNDGVASAVVSNFMENEAFFGAMEFVTVGGTLSYGWNEEKTLPSVGSRAFNADYTEDNGETKPLQEALKLYGGLIGVDRMATAQLGEEVVGAKLDAQIKALRLAIINDFFNGSSATDVNDMDGLKTLLPTTTAGRVDRGYVVNNGGAALSRAKLDEAIGNTDTGAGTVIFTDKMVPYYINQYGESLVTFDKNEFGVPVARYGDIPIVTVDRNNSNAKILGFTEASSTSSMFIANVGVDGVAMLSGQTGITSSPTEQSGSRNKNQVDWLVAALVKGDYNLARLYNFTATAMVA